MKEWLGRERDLRLKYPQARILSCHGHLNALGYRLTRYGIDALPRALSRLHDRVEAELMRPPWKPQRFDLDRSIAASAGIVLF